ncbi:MAG: hypothetical protein RLZZ628_658 [Bacteroidota bacterium]|jgi:hypothetical protein
MDDSSVVLYKKLTTRAVRHAAEMLMRQNGSTSTLEVKMLLRTQLYMAFQKDVSSKMNTLATQCGWNHAFNGSFKEYRLFPLTYIQPNDDDVNSASDDTPLLNA